MSNILQVASSDPVANAYPFGKNWKYDNYDGDGDDGGDDGDGGGDGDGGDGDDVCLHSTQVCTLPCQAAAAAAACGCLRRGPEDLSRSIGSMRS